MIMTTKIIQNLLTMQHLNRRHHYRSMIWVNANICVPESSKRIFYSKSRDSGLDFSSRSEI